MAMSVEPFGRRQVASALLQLFPPMLRASVLDDDAFRERYALTVNTTIELSPSGLKLDRAKLFDAIRELLGALRSDVEVESEDGVRWKLFLREADQRIVLKGEVEEIILPDFSCLWPDAAKRLAWFDRQADAFELNGTPAGRWREKLSRKAIEDEEVDELLSELRLTPVGVARSVRQRLTDGTTDISSLVPPDIRYYERLVGEPRDQAKLRNFAEAVAGHSVEAWIRKQPLEGLKHALLLSSQPSLIKAINLENVPRDVVLRVYRWLEESGDRISQLGGIECGFAYLDLIPELEFNLVNLIRCFLDDDPINVASRLTLLSSLIVMIEGEIARTSIAKGRPPFWRRLATIAHASVLEREFNVIGMPSSEFIEWAMQSRGQLFYLQTYIDLRSEPRWLPDFVLPGQLKAECIGRIALAAHQNSAKIQTPPLKALLFAQGPGTVQEQLSLPYSSMPGPLEGGLEAGVVMPSELELELRTELDTVELTPKTFAKLVNSALFFQIGPQLAELAAKALRSA